MGFWNKYESGKKGAGKPLDLRLFELSVLDMDSKYGEMQGRMVKSCPTALSFDYVPKGDDDVAGGAVDQYPNGTLINVVSPALFEWRQGSMTRLGAMLTTFSGDTIVSHVVVQNHEAEHARQHAFQYGIVTDSYFTEDQFDDGYESVGNAYFALLRVCEKYNPFCFNGKRGVPRTWDNYFHDPSEIMAAKAGYIKGYEDLKQMFPDVSDDQCRLAVLNQLEQECFMFGKDGNGDVQRVGKRPYYIELDMDCDWTVMTMEDLGKKFDEACLLAWKRQVKYSLIYPMWGPDCQRDEFCRTVALTGSCDRTDRETSPWDSVYDEFVKEGIDLRRSVEVMGAVTLMNHPDWYETYPVLGPLAGRLDPDVMFGEGFQEKAKAYDEARGRKSPYMEIRQPVQQSKSRSDRVGELENKFSDVFSFDENGSNGKTGKTGPGE